MPAQDLPLMRVAVFISSRKQVEVRLIENKSVSTGNEGRPLDPTNLIKVITTFPGDATPQGELETRDFRSETRN